MAIETTVDAFLGGRVMLEQPVRGYRAGLDAVLLAATVEIAEGGRGAGASCILDVGAGAGAVGLCIAARLPGVHAVLLEREPELAAIARRNAAASPACDRLKVVEASIGAGREVIVAAGLEDGSFDHVVANPPYHDARAGTPAPDRLKANSHAMPGGDLDGWVRFAARMARPGATATFVHKAADLAALLQAFDGRFGGIVVRPVHPRRNSAANRVLVRGTKGSRAPLILSPPVVLHGDEGNEVLPDIATILRDGAALAMLPVGTAKA